MPAKTPTTSPIIVALDVASKREAIELADQLDPQLCRAKIGKELFTRCGPSIVRTISKMGFEIFLDLKFHDIPNTVNAAVAVAADLGVWMVNVHASGGGPMLEAAAAAVENKPTLLTAVTVLTSLSTKELQEMGVFEEPAVRVQKLARLAQRSGLDGVVCSAQEANVLKPLLGDDFLLVTPGIRPENYESDDQRRVVTPKKALANGSDYLVIGRPVTQAQSPREALTSIYNSLQT